MWSWDSMHVRFVYSRQLASPHQCACVSAQTIDRESGASDSFSAVGNVKIVYQPMLEQCQAPSNRLSAREKKSGK